jgi:hypothetical protein
MGSKVTAPGIHKLGTGWGCVPCLLAFGLDRSLLRAIAYTHLRLKLGVTFSVFIAGLSGIKLHILSHVQDTC